MPCCDTPRFISAALLAGFQSKTRWDGYTRAFRRSLADKWHARLGIPQAQLRFIQRRPTWLQVSLQTPTHPSAAAAIISKQACAGSGKTTGETFVVRASSRLEFVRGLFEFQGGCLPLGNSTTKHTTAKTHHDSNVDQNTASNVGEWSKRRTIRVDSSFIDNDT